MTRELAARLRNLFQPGVFRRRYPDGRVQVETHNGRVVEGREAFPYGFRAAAKGGRVLALCQGGDTGATVMLPVLGGEGAPELGDGDVALYTAGGSRVVLREAGGLEIYAAGTGDVSVVGSGGKLLFANDAANLCEVLCGILDEIAALVTAGSPTSQQVNPASKAKLEAYKSVVRALLKEGN